MSFMPPNFSKSLTEQRGIAVILALLIVVLAGLIVGSLLWQQSSLLSTVQQQKITIQAAALQKTSVFWAERILREDARTSSYDDLTEPWAQPLAETPISEALGSAAKENFKNDSLPEAYIAGQIEDAQAKFNIRNLMVSPYPNKVEFVMFKKLLKNLNLDEAIATKIQKHFYPNWRDEDENQEKLPPSKPPKPLITLLDLRAVIGSEAYTRLEPFVVWLPEATPVNANTTSAEVLSARIENLDLPTAKRLIGERKIGSFKDTNDVLNRIGGLNLKAATNDIDTKTQFFFVEGRLRFDQINIRYLSLIHRVEGKTTIVSERRL